MIDVGLRALELGAGVLIPKVASGIRNYLTKKTPRELQLVSIPGVDRLMCEKIGGKHIDGSCLKNAYVDKR